MEELINQLRFNIAIRLLITLYSADGIWKFIAYIPGDSEDDDEILWCGHCNYCSTLIISIIFCIIWILAFQYTNLVYITIWEIIIIIAIYLHLINSKQNYLQEKKEKLKYINERKIAEMNRRLS